MVRLHFRSPRFSWRSEGTEKEWTEQAAGKAVAGRKRALRIPGETLFPLSVLAY